MGLYDREYYQDERPGSFGAAGARSVTVNLIIITVVAFFLNLLSPWIEGEALGRAGGAHSLGWHLGLHVATQPLTLWQIVTYAFVHGSILHLFFNMLTLFFFGPPFESQRGRQEMVWYYLAAAAFSGLVWLAGAWLSGREGAWVIGASGATTAVLLWFVFNYPNQPIYLWGVVAIPAWILGAVLVGMNLINALGARESDVAFTAHLGGAAFAALYHFGRFRFSRPGGGYSGSSERRSGKRRGLSLNLNWLKRQPKLKVHNPEEYYERLDAEADRILAKIHNEGEDSLTREERRTLEDYSRRMRQKLR